MVDHKGGLLIGLDLKKSISRIESAYNDSKGITAAFNKNMLVHINALTGSNFGISNWEHSAVYDENEGCINMHLISNRAQQVQIRDNSFEFHLDESIHTESCYKFSLYESEALFNQAGFTIKNYWTDVNGLFALIYCEAS